MTDYNDKRGFPDPVIRCDQCGKLTHRAFITKFGGCCHCGNKRFKSVVALTEDEYAALLAGTLDVGTDKGYKIDPEYLNIFEAQEEIADDKA
jgi:predicted  nucleic acid-binding Zn-ribbon protein